MTKLQIRQRILRALNDDPDNPVFWTPGEIDDAVQDGMERLAEESEALKRTFTISRRPGTMIYHTAALGPNIMAPYRIWLPDLTRRLEAWSITDLDGRDEQWMQVTGDPWVWWPIDWQQFGVWPVPAAGGGLMEVSCYVWPDALLDEDDMPEFYTADHEALVFYGEVEGYLKQHDVLRALDVSQQWAQRWGKAATRASVKQMQAAFHVRERSDAHGQFD